MTEQLDPKPTYRVLEDRDGSGYQAAVAIRWSRRSTPSRPSSLRRAAEADLKRLAEQQCKSRRRRATRLAGTCALRCRSAALAPCTISAAAVGQLRNGCGRSYPSGPSTNQQLYLSGKLVDKSVVRRSPEAFVSDEVYRRTGTSRLHFFVVNV